MRKIYVLLFVLLLSCSSVVKVHQLSEVQLRNRQETDLKSIKICRQGLAEAERFIKINPDIFPRKKAGKGKFLNHLQRETAVQVWETIIDYYYTIDSISSFHKDFMLIKDKELRAVSYNIMRYSFMTEYRFALEYLSVFENTPQLDILLNEQIPGLSTGENLYDTYKKRFLSVQAVTRFASFQSSEKLFACNDELIKRGIKEDVKVILNLKKHKGPILTAKNSLKEIQENNEKFWFPVQKGVSTWMGDTKVYRIHDYLVNDSQIEYLKNNMVPGDVMLQRREWYLSNAGLPGFWTHSALYVGSVDEMNEYFSGEDLKKEFKLGDNLKFSDVLKQKYPNKFAKYITPNTHNESFRVIEAISEGVMFTSIEHSAHCDSIAVLRPKLSKIEKAYAIIAAFEYQGRPYDFNFDFNSDSELVCTELIYKVFEKTPDSRGISFPLRSMLGRKLISANDIAKMYSKHKKKSTEQFEFILFYDGNEKDKESELSNEEIFLSSYERPKWHVLKK